MTYPRVTEVLRPFCSYENVPAEILNRAAARGTTTHAICTALAKGEWIPDNMVDEELRGYVSSFKAWANKEVATYEVIEKRYKDDVMQYSGQVDFVILNKASERWLVDLKTSARPQKTYPVQMAAYEWLLYNHDIHVKGAQLVYLSKTGEYPKVHCIEELSEEGTVFSSALRCWNYFNKGKKNGKSDTDRPGNTACESNS